MSLDSKHFCDIICAYLAVLCWYKVIPTDGVYPLFFSTSSVGCLKVCT